MRLIDILRKELPSISITTDIIAGFPQESEEDHEWTIQALKQAAFDGIFAFNYSPRSRTKAALLSGHIEEGIKSRRLNEILELQNEITDNKSKDLVGSIQEVLLETEISGDNSSLLTGRTRTNKIVSIVSDGKARPSDLVRVKIVNANRHSLHGEII
jgi:tRNA-2-methylthio-N6-dimethylallyladenosine synthase